MNKNIILLIQQIMSFIISLFSKKNNNLIIPVAQEKTESIELLPAKPPQMHTNQELVVEKKLFTIPNPATDITGTEFINSIMNVPPNQKREDLIFEQYKAGHVPAFMREPSEVTVTAGTNTLKYWVLPDVLCVGVDEDYIRTPLNPLTARKVADLFNCMLPTPKMAYQIWQAASIKLKPSPNGAPYTDIQQTTSKLWEHEQKIRQELIGIAPGKLISGHKKDVVITKALFNNLNNVAIVGWWYPDGKKIQPLNAVSHVKSFKDYSHGIRMICRTAELNGIKCDLFDVLKDDKLSSLISDEGSYDADKLYK